jgi:hypothetical protein
MNSRLPTHEVRLRGLTYPRPLPKGKGEVAARADFVRWQVQI